MSTKPIKYSFTVVKKNPGNSNMPLGIARLTAAQGLRVSSDIAPAFTSETKQRPSGATCTRIKIEYDQTRKALRLSKASIDDVSAFMFEVTTSGSVATHLRNNRLPMPTGDYVKLPNSNIFILAE